MSENDNKNKDEWGEMASLWQGQKVSVPEGLSKKIQWKTRQMYLIFGFEALITFLVVSAGIWLLLSKNEKIPQGIIIFGITVALIGLGVSWWIRRGIWTAKSTSTLDQVKLSKKRAKASIQFADYNLWSIALGLAFVSFAVWIKYPVFTAKYENGDLSSIWALGAVSLFLLLFGVGSLIYRSKKKEELAFYSNLLEQLMDDEK